MEDLKDRTAVVTGAAGGIGLAITEAFVAQGMRVAMIDVNAQALAAHASRLTSQGAAVRALVADVSDPDVLEAVGDEVLTAFGALHVAVNNAGIQLFGGISELSLDDWCRVIDVNLWGVVHGVRAFVPRMIAGGEERHLVNVGSIASLHAIPNIGPYVVAKHGVLGLTEVVRAEIAATTSRIGVSLLLPGWYRPASRPLALPLRQPSPRTSSTESVEIVPTSIPTTSRKTKSKSASPKSSLLAARWFRERPVISP
jgi:NAD(P)-dependent dehydrogenase (short-subunit alcohol dehydrogenase family)